MIVTTGTAAMHRQIGLFAAATALTAMPTLLHATPTEKILTFFHGELTADTPTGALIQDSSGALYGTTSNTRNNRDMAPHGTVFKLTPPAAGQKAWTLTTLYVFPAGSAGGHPPGALVMDATGALYGAAYTTKTSGGGYIFKLTPPAAGSTTWSESDVADIGGIVEDSLLQRADGTMLGAVNHATASAGFVVELTPPAGGVGQWTQTVLYQFQGGDDGAYPNGGLTADKSGALYGTTQQGGPANFGTVYKLTPPAKGQTSWTKTTLHSFQGGDSDGAYPTGKVAVDAEGDVFGTTPYGDSYDNGVSYELTPPVAGQTTWTETIIQVAAQTSGPPMAGLQLLGNGDLLGTGSDTVFKLEPPMIGQSEWKFRLIYTFKGGKTDGIAPVGGVLRVAGGTLFGTTQSGGPGRCEFGCGTVFEITP